MQKNLNVGCFIPKTPFYQVLENICVSPSFESSKEIPLDFFFLPPVEHLIGKNAQVQDIECCGRCPQEPDETSTHSQKFDTLLAIGEGCNVGNFSLLFLPKWSSAYFPCSSLMGPGVIRAYK